MSMISKKLRNIVIPVAVAAASTLAFSTNAVAEWSPKKPVDFVIMAGLTLIHI